jgi:hypothetical protein
MSVGWALVTTRTSSHVGAWGEGKETEGKEAVSARPAHRRSEKDAHRAGKPQRLLPSSLPNFLRHRRWQVRDEGLGSACLTSVWLVLGPTHCHAAN